MQAFVSNNSTLKNRSMMFVKEKFGGNGDNNRRKRDRRRFEDDDRVKKEGVAEITTNRSDSSLDNVSLSLRNFDLIEI